MHCVLFIRRLSEPFAIVTDATLRLLRSMTVDRQSTIHSIEENCVVRGAEAETAEDCSSKPGITVSGGEGITAGGLEDGDDCADVSGLPDVAASSSSESAS